MPKKPLQFIIPICLLVFLPPAGMASSSVEMPGSVASVAAYHRSLMRIEEMLESKSMELGAPIFIRIFKRSSELEVWLKKGGGRFELFKTYIICRYSGDLGPKLKQGDKQAPEGFYSVRYDRMNPWSKNHLSFNLGYPNIYDQTLNRSGSALMVHGGCSSTGCYAMTDYYMDEIYTLADAALTGGQTEIQVHVFPFRLTLTNLSFYRSSPWYEFWMNLKQGYDLFEKYRLPPRVEVIDQRYVFSHQYDRSIVQIGS
ncbi:MAG: murein L,D-transpeptidase [Desulfofustis sp.]|nr:murein L,D-transpeptidase [Desulfofustis sp.]